MSEPEPGPPLLVLDNTCLSAFSSAGLMGTLRTLTAGFRVGTTEAVREEFLAGPHPPADLGWVEPLPEVGIEELVALAAYVNALGAGQHDLGEATVFASARVRGGTAITDDAAATKIARRLGGVQVHGSLWLIVNAHRAGTMTKATAATVLDALRAAGSRFPCDGRSVFEWARQHNLLD